MIPPDANDILGLYAFEFRTAGQEDKHKIAQKYADFVKRLIANGHLGKPWTEIPGPEDQLPDEYMPAEFFSYWKPQ